MRRHLSRSNLLYLKCILILITSLHVRVYGSEFYSAMTDIKDLLKLEKNTLVKLEEYMNKQKPNSLNNTLEILLKTMRKQQSNAMNMKNYELNPINALKLIRRMLLYAKFLNGFGFVKDILRIFPVKADINGAVLGLNRLQMTYSLRVEDLSNGYIIGKNSGTGKSYVEESAAMTADECYDVGMKIRTQNNKLIFNTSLQWLKVALAKFKNCYYHPEFHVPEERIVYNIIKTYKALGDFYNSTMWTNKLHTILKSKPKLMEKYRKLLMAIKSPVKLTPLLTRQLIPVTKYKYEDICRGANYVPSDISKKLKCMYLFGKQPFLKLAPVKMEQLYLHPEIYIFHDVISESEIKVMKEIARPLLNRAHVQLRNGSNAKSFGRITKVAIINYSNSYNAVVKRLARRIEDFTGLDLMSNEPEGMQVANYGIGGHFTPHYDYLDESFSLHDRYSTVIFYLSNVAQGGATAFLDLGLTVFPMKGSALYFKNLLVDDSGNPDTIHCGCPLLTGNKWLLIKWISKFGQRLICERRRGESNNEEYTITY